MNPIVSNGNRLGWKFEDVKNFGKEKISDIFTIENLDWRISVRPNGNVNDCYLEINLHCDSANNDKNWICEANSKIKLINQEGSKRNIQSYLKECYHQERNKCGIKKFTPWNNLDEGYRSDYLEIIVEIDLSFKYHDFSTSISNFTEVIVNVENTEFHLNKWVLSTKSEYFYDLFVNKKVEDTKIELKDVNAVDFCYMLVSFTYGFNTNLDVKYPELIKLAKTLGVQSLHHACEQYLISRTDMAVIDRIKIADENGYENLMEKCIESLSTVKEIRLIQSDRNFAELEKTTQLRIMFRLLDCV